MVGLGHASPAIGTDESDARAAVDVGVAPTVHHDLVPGVAREIAEVGRSASDPSPSRRPPAAGDSSDDVSTVRLVAWYCL
jgi:hypothetical protein